MKPTDLHPTREIILIERAVEDDFFEGTNLIRAQNQKAEMGVATVLAVGPEVLDKYEVGDKVYIGKLMGLKVMELNGPYFLVHHTEIMAKVTE
jgi:co-chaperonin GroES (HSP10)